MLQKPSGTGAQLGRTLVSEIRR